MNPIVRWLVGAHLLPFALFAAPPAPPEIPPDLEYALFRNADSRAAFDAAVTKAEKLGIPDAKLVEAQIISGIREGETDLCALGLARATKPGLAMDDRLRALVAMGRGYVAGREHRFADAEREFKEAFWLDAELAATVNDAAAYTRTMQRMAGVTLDLDRSYPSSSGGSVSLRALLQGKKALLLDFWASWCVPCVRGMPDLKARQATLAPKGIAVAALNTEGDTAKAEAMRKRQAIEFPWLMDSAETPLAALLGIDTIPRAVLVSPEGKILYNGDVPSPVLDATLASVAPVVVDENAPIATPLPTTAAPAAATTDATSRLPTAANARATIEAVIAQLLQPAAPATRLARWRELRERLSRWHDRVLAHPGDFTDAEAIGLLKLHTYFDLLPAGPVTPAAARVVRNTVLVSAAPWADPHTAADLSPEALLALRALAAWCGDATLAHLPTR